MRVTPEIECAMRMLGWNPEQVQQQPSPAYAQEEWKRQQQGAKKRFKEMSLELHPDRTNNDPEKTERFKALAQAADIIAALQLQIVAPPPPPRVVLIVINTGYASTFTGSSTTAGFGFWPF